MSIDLYLMRQLCKHCGHHHGTRMHINGQETIRCAHCNRRCYNAPRTETGQAQRTVTTIHNGIKPTQRTRVLTRANGQCEICGFRINLHVGHIISVKDGLESGLRSTTTPTSSPPARNATSDKGTYRCHYA